MPEPHPFIPDPPLPASTGGVKPGAEPCVTLLPTCPSSHILYFCRPRRQYIGEPFGNGNGSSPSSSERHPYRGLPNDSRPAYKAQPGLRPESNSRPDPRSPSPVAAHTRGTGSAQYPMPVPDTSPSLGTHAQPWSSQTAARNFSINGASGSSPQMQPPYRPPGTAAPRIPGHPSSSDHWDDASSSSPSVDLYSPISNASSSYFPLDASYLSNVASLSNIPPPPPLKSSPHVPTPAPPNRVLDRNSSDDILAPGNHGFARPLSHSK
jgi:hypothetical protein